MSFELVKFQQLYSNVNCFSTQIWEKKYEIDCLNKQLMELKFVTEKKNNDEIDRYLFDEILVSNLK